MHRNYHAMYKYYMKYEEIAVDYFADSEADKRILTHPYTGDMEQKINDAYGPNYKNPYREAYTWIKGELLDTRGMLDAFNSYKKLLDGRSSLIKKRQDDQKELANLNAKKTSMRNFFKSGKSKEESKYKLIQTIDADELTISNYNKVINFLTILNGTTTTKMFKTHKVEQYKKMLAYFASHEIHNQTLTSTLATTLLQLESKKEEQTSGGGTGQDSD